jgi:hypothetical protein
MSDIGAILETGGAAAVELAASALAERGGKLGACANCKEPLLGPYCAVCGQPRDVHRRSMGRLLADLVQDLISFDSRILRTARALALTPGELPLAFHQGRTQPYVPAVRLYLFVSLLFFLTLSLTHLALVQFHLAPSTQSFQRAPDGTVLIMVNGKSRPMTGLHADAKGNVFAGSQNVPVPGIKADGSVNTTVNLRPVFFLPIQNRKPDLPAALKADLKQIQDSSKGEGLFVRTITGMIQTLAADPAALNGPLTEWLPRLLFLLLPLFATVLMLAYWKRRTKWFFVDHLVFSLNFHSFGFVVLLAAAGLAQLLPGQVAGLITVGAVNVYLFAAMKRFYGDGWIRTAVKFAAVGFVYSVFILLPAFAGLILASIFYG